MTSSDHNSNATRPDAAGDQLTRLLKLAGKRPEPSSEMAAEVREVVAAAWQQKTNERARAGRIRKFAVAAALVAGLAVTLRFVVPLGPLTTEQFANVVRATGGVELRDSSTGEWREIVADAVSLQPGAQIRTGPQGRVALAMNDARSVRLDFATEIELISHSRIGLSSGRIYVDSAGHDPDDDGIGIVTPLGTVLEIGTQFEVRYDGREARVRVREGRVSFETDRVSANAVAGEQVAVTGTGDLGRSRIDLHGAEWRWAESIAPVFEVDGAGLGDFLEWISRETGRDIEFADDATAQAVKETVLRGSIDGLLPGDALAAVLATTRFDYETSGSAIRIYAAATD